MGNLGTVEPEKGKYYFESVAPAPGFLQMINDWENKVFDSLPFAGTSWAPETANETRENLFWENVLNRMVLLCCWRLL